MRNYAWLRRLWRVTCITILLAGCTYRGDIDNPAVRKVSWFSYLDGTDIRTACVEGAPDSYRLVYNGRYEEQVRSYEITADGAGGAYLTARAKGRTNAFDVSFDDVLAPWRWKRSRGPAVAGGVPAIRARCWSRAGSSPARPSACACSPAISTGSAAPAGTARSTIMPGRSRTTASLKCGLPISCSSTIKPDWR